MTNHESEIDNMICEFNSFRRRLSCYVNWCASIDPNEFQSRISEIDDITSSLVGATQLNCANCLLIN
jgi:hypothetical protein